MILVLSNGITIYERDASDPAPSPLDDAYWGAEAIPFLPESLSPDASQETNNTPPTPVPGDAGSPKESKS